MTTFDGFFEVAVPSAGTLLFGMIGHVRGQPEMLLTCITRPLISTSQAIPAEKLLTLWIILCHTVRGAPETARRGGRKVNEMATHRSRFSGKSPTPIVGSMAGRPKRAADGRDLYHGLPPQYSDTLAIFLLKARRREKDHDRVMAERAGQSGPSNMNRIEKARRIAFALRLGSEALAAQRNNPVDQTMHQSLSSTLKSFTE